MGGIVVTKAVNRGVAMEQSIVQQMLSEASHRHGRIAFSSMLPVCATCG